MANNDLGFGDLNTSFNNDTNSEKQKTKKQLAIIFAAMFILAIIVVVLLVLISKGKKPTLSLNIDGTTITGNKVYYEYDNTAKTWFFSVKDLATTLNYTYNRGGIDITDESENNCTIVNPNKLEKIIFESNKQELTKYYTYSNALVENQHFDIKQMIRYDTINKRILADQSAIERAFNCSISYDETTLKLSIQTLEGSLIRTYQNSHPNAAKEGFSDEIRFQNNKALLRGLVIVKDPVTGLYGIDKYNGDTKSYVSVVGTKYKSFQFIEGLNKFVAQGENNKYGILSENGEVDVNLTYTYLFCIDIKRGLYVAGTDSGKQCVVSGATAQTSYTSRIIVPADFDKIGISGNNYSDDKLEGDYILCQSLIPVQKNGKWGFYSVDGTKVVDPIYDGVGCAAPQGEVTGGRANIKGCVVIPDISAIVIKENKEIADEKGNKRVTAFYGLINYKGELKVQTVATAIFSSTENGERTYFFGNAQEQINIVSYWREQNLGDSIYTTTKDQGNISFVNSSVDQNQTVDQNQIVDQQNVNQQTQNTQVVDQQNTNQPNLNPQTVDQQTPNPQVVDQQNTNQQNPDQQVPNQQMPNQQVMN